MGAYESQGFSLSINAGDNQSAARNSSFAEPLSVTVTALNTIEPVDGGRVWFTAPLSGASALISGSPAVISSAAASVTATANNSPGAYTVYASALGANLVSFNLQNIDNDAPVITSNGGAAAASVSVAENTTAVTTVTATDADGGALTYSISGGADAAFFGINASTGALAFTAAPDFETPLDSGADNTYMVIVQVSDGSLTDTQTITVTVTDVNDTYFLFLPFIMR